MAVDETLHIATTISKTRVVRLVALAPLYLSHNIDMLGDIELWHLLEEWLYGSVEATAAAII
jgi:hypothetical protein